MGDQHQADIFRLPDRCAVPGLQRAGRKRRELGEDVGGGEGVADMLELRAGQGIVGEEADGVGAKFTEPADKVVPDGSPFLGLGDRMVFFGYDLYVPDRSPG